MEYIILDLEWDSIYYKPEKRFINHILQIGAVKLDENFNTIDTLYIYLGTLAFRSTTTSGIFNMFLPLKGGVSASLESKIWPEKTSKTTHHSHPETWREKRGHAQSGSAS